MARPGFMCCVLLAGFLASAEAQVTTGSIVGTVRDASGGVLPGASVMAINVDTNFSRTEVTNQRGEYALQYLPPGPTGSRSNWPASSAPFTLGFRSS